jgi:hypothetical protein
MRFLYTETQGKFDPAAEQPGCKENGRLFDSLNARKENKEIRHSHTNERDR